ncbi:MAG: caspase family protein [Saprospiraceae bacterium]
MKKTNLLLLFFCLSFCTLLSAQCISGDCNNGKGIFLFPGGAKYIGQFHRGEIQGLGSFYYTNGGTYRGEWQRGKQEGKGYKTQPDGTRLEGIWKGGRLIENKDITGTFGQQTDLQESGCISGDCISGQGVYIHPNGSVYIGAFKDGEINGMGICHYPDGSKYQGEWYRRYPEGNGTKWYVDGSTRTGHWKRGQPVDAYGKYAPLKGTNPLTEEFTIQSGCLKGDCSNGNGVFAYPDGSKYEGYFVLNKPEGKGTFFYPNGDKYKGEFRQGYRHGKGSLQHAQGKITEGLWKEGEFIGGDKNATNNSIGCVEGDCQNGYGKYVYRDGAKYEGTFKNGFPHGRGVVIYQNGERYEGEMANAAFSGFGTLFMQDGLKASGYWKDGTFIGNQSPYDTHDTQQTPAYVNQFANPNFKVWAVIVGVSAYDHMPVLKYPDDDAYRIYAFLKSPEGGALDDEQIRILIDEDATKAKITQTMKDLFWKAGPNDLVFLYFSGHGLKGAFLPIDFDGASNKLYHEEVNAILNLSRAKLKLCIADACHSGSLLAMRDGRYPAALNTYYESLAQSKEGTALIMSSKSDETSLESSGLRQGVFSHFLIRGLKGEADANRNKIVTIQELFDFVYNRVRSYTGNRQSPVIQGNYDTEMTVGVSR